MAFGIVQAFPHPPPHSDSDSDQTLSQSVKMKMKKKESQRDEEEVTSGNFELLLLHLMALRVARMEPVVGTSGADSSY